MPHSGVVCADDAGNSIPSRPPLVLASGSRYRAELLATAGIAAEVDPPEVDERAADALMAELGPDGLAVELALRKALAVAPRHRGRVILAADQVGVLAERSGGVQLLTKQPGADGAVAQLMAMSGERHHLVNGVVVLGPTGSMHSGVDVQVVTMRAYDERTARAYVELFSPFDTAGSYRLEDGEELERRHGAGAGLVASVTGEHPSGVVGLPLPLVARLLADVEREGART